MWKKLALVLGTGFGLGYSPFAPGTVGCLLGVPLACWSNQHGLGFQVAFAIALALLAVPICEYAERQFPQKDPHAIVADEYLTFPLCLLGLPVTWAEGWWLLPLAFVTNRVMDILKPPPARQLQAWHGGAGIVIDDVFSSLYSLALNHALYRLLAPHL